MMNMIRITKNKVSIRRRDNESDENSDEIRVDGNNDKNEDYGDNDEQDVVSQ